MLQCTKSAKIQIILLKLVPIDILNNFYESVIAIKHLILHFYAVITLNFELT